MAFGTSNFNDKLDVPFNDSQLIAKSVACNIALMAAAKSLADVVGEDGAQEIEAAIEVKYGETAEIVGVLGVTTTQPGNPDPLVGSGIKIIIQLQDELNNLAGKISVGYNPQRGCGVVKPSSRGGYGPITR